LEFKNSEKVYYSPIFNGSCCLPPFFKYANRFGDLDIIEKFYIVKI
jgi:hypothetical protein